MGKRLGLLETNPKRRTRSLAVSLEPDTLRLVRQFCPPGARHLGVFFTKLVWDFAAREDERQRRGDHSTAAETPALVDVGRAG
jgi:hypothetical protein